MPFNTMPQEMVDKAPQLPGDISWHFIGHLQSNKVKASCARLALGRSVCWSQVPVRTESDKVKASEGHPAVSAAVGW